MKNLIYQKYSENLISRLSETEKNNYELECKFWEIDKKKKEENNLKNWQYRSKFVGHHQMPKYICSRSYDMF